MEFDFRKDKNLKIKHFKEYFAEKNEEKKEEYKTQRMFVRAVKLEKIMQILNSDMLDIVKISEISKIYRSADSFIGEYSELEKYSDDSVIGNYIEIIKKIEEYYRELESKNLISRSKELLDMEENKYFDDYIYACEIVNEYINYNESIYTEDFLKYFNLKDYQFNRFVEIVANFNGKLYEKYLSKSKENRKLRKYEVVEKIRKAKEAIKTGFTEDGKKFDEIEYYKTLPFYTKITAIEVLDDFNIKQVPYMFQKYKALIQTIDPDAFQPIMNYVNEKKLYLENSPTIISEKDIKSTRFIIKGQELNQEDKEIIIDYMKKEKIPFLIAAFNVVRDNYLENGLNFEKNLTLKK